MHAGYQEYEGLGLSESAFNIHMGFTLYSGVAYFCQGRRDNLGHQVLKNATYFPLLKSSISKSDL